MAAARSHTREEDADGGDLLRIHAVSEITGIPEPTLRAWERRYGIPSPSRTASGYRLFGPREVEELRAMRRLCDRGVSVSEAARSIKARREVVPVVVAPSEVLGSGAASELEVASILEAVDRFDVDAIDESLRKLTAVGAPLAVLDRVLRPTLVIIGRYWAEGRISIAQEHLVSQRVGKVMRDLLGTMPGATSGRRVVLGSFADDEHELGLLGAAMRFSDWGYRPIVLGARTPPSAIRAAVAAMSPVVVATSVTIAPRTRTRELCLEYRAACGSVPWLVGGGAAAEIADDIEASGGTVAPASTEELRAAVARLVDPTSG